MSLSSLQVLANNRDALLLAEVAAWLHDVGKFADLHIEHHTTNPSRKWSNDDAYKVVIDTPASVIKLSQSAANIKKPDILNNVLNATSPKAADLLPAALKQNLQSLHVNLLSQDYSLAELIMLGMPGFATHQQRGQFLDGKDGLLPALLGVCHNVAHVDKEDPIGGGQSLPNVLASNAFGYEHQTFILGDPQKSLDARLRQMSFDFTNLSAMRQEISQAFEYGLGDTRRPINEVSLADWSAIVAALFKAALAGAVLTKTQPGIRGWKSWKDKIIDHDFRWRLLRVNFDVLGLYAKAVKIADLLGYHRAVEEACQKIKQLVEEEYPLGNEIYRDTTGIYFTFPDLDLPAELEQEIRRRFEEVEPELAPRIAVTVGDGETAQEQLKGILAKARHNAVQVLLHPFDSQNLSTCWQQQWETVGEGKWELCPVCRLRPMREGQEACEHCLKRRSSRIAEWQQNPHRTVWMDELADVNGRLALLVGKFGLDNWLSGELVQTMLVQAEQNNPAKCVPKSPSPARLRRVWETCQRFWTETAQGILDALPRRERWLLEVQDKSNLPPHSVACDGTLNGQPISVWRMGDALLTISFVPEEPKPGRLILSWEHNARKGTGEYQVQGVQAPSANYLKYHPNLTLLASPDQFLALVPAADAPQIAAKVRDEYAKQFGKVQNRLPLFLGLVFFPRKMPLMAVMDAARRMLEVQLDCEQWSVDSMVVEHQGCELKLEKYGHKMTLRVPKTMGDGSEDKWYPYFQVERFADGTPDHRTYRFQRDDRWLIHVNDLRKDDVVHVTPSRFAYLWLEHTAKRFEFDPQRDMLLLDELPRLREMWEKICRIPEMTDTKLRGVQALLETKGMAWERATDTFQKLTETTIKRAGMLDAVTPEDVTSGRFARCLELHTKILKLRL